MRNLPRSEFRNMGEEASLNGAMARKRASDVQSTPVVRSLRLAEGTPAEAFERLAKAIDAGEVTIGDAKHLADILERRLKIMDAEAFRKRLELAEARALEAQKQRAALPVPASQAVVEAP